MAPGNDVMRYSYNGYQVMHRQVSRHVLPESFHEANYSVHVIKIISNTLFASKHNKINV